ncbi:MAG: disulfide bond formation protein B [Actinomycetota bacterium]
MTNTMSLFYAFLTVGANVAVVGALVLVVGARRSPAIAGMLERVRAQLAFNGTWMAWIVAVVAMTGSLFFSEVANFPPCKLCWYQRIAMYPLVAILYVGAALRDRRIRIYALPLVVVGGAISSYHYLLERFPNLGSSACEVTNPCTVLWVWRFHYISIPFMALSAFALILTLLVLTPRLETTDVTEPSVPIKSEEPQGELV